MNQRRHPVHMMRRLGRPRDYAYATLAALAAFALAFLAERYLSVANLALIFLTAVLAVAVRTRMSVAVYTAVLCFLGYNFFFTPPRYTLAIANADDLLAVSLFLIVALVCSHLATKLAQQVESLRAAQVRARAVVYLGQRLSASTDARSIREAGADAMAHALQAQVAMLAHGATERLTVATSVPPGMTLNIVDYAAAESSESDKIPIGRFTKLMPDASCWLLPLCVEDRCLGVIALRFDAQDDALDADRGHLALAMAQDIGLALERARLADELGQARVEGETERLRNALLSSVSHDLRSPLVSMIGAAGTLAAYEQQLPASERHELLDTITGEGQRLDRYIQNLLDMTRLGHGTLHLHRDWVDASDIALAAIGRVQRAFPKLQMETQLPKDTVLLYVHPALIEQALFNIMENAAHFSPLDRPVHLRMRVAGSQLLVDVIDHGPGVPEAERANIFDTFYSVARGDRGKHGTGLGLSICRGMIGAHSGQLEVLPTDGGGTTMRVTLPLLPVPGSGS
ncbi:MAG: sensor histidine kinase [Rhodanobacteraceae bacterium]